MKPQLPCGRLQETPAYKAPEIYQGELIKSLLTCGLLELFCMNVFLEKKTIYYHEAVILFNLRKKLSLQGKTKFILKLIASIN